MDIKVDNCRNCPFCYFEIDDWGMKHHHCVMAMFLNIRPYMLKTNDSRNWGPVSKKTPKWCPIKNQDVNVQFNKK